jgi:hypothetical protein
MKCLALRLSEEFQDLADIKVLIGVLGIQTVEAAEVVLEELFNKS